MFQKDDPLSELVQGAGLRARIVGSFSTTAALGFAFPGTLDASLHVVLEGEAWVGNPDAETQRVGSGEVFFLARDVQCVVGGSATPQPLEPPRDRGIPRIVRAEIGSPTVFRVLTVGYEYENCDVGLAAGALLGAMRFDLPTTILDDANRIALRTRLEAPGAQGATLRQAEGLFCEILAIALSRTDSSLSNALGDVYLTTVLRAVHADIAGAWTVGRLAKLAGLSRTAFYTRFSRAMGIAPIDYVRRVRVRRAITLLRSTSMSIGEVADAVGYVSASSFSRAFVAVTGRRPGASDLKQIPGR